MTMRSSLRHHLHRAIGRGEIAKLAFASLRAGAARLSLDLPEAWRGPLLSTFAITWRCPLRCAMCDLPLRRENELSDADVLRFVDSIAKLRPLGLGFTGGEPLVRPVVFDAIERSVQHGLVTHLNTSGAGLDEEGARRLARSGIASINVSIDHDSATEHDELRGRSGAFEQAIRSLDLLVAARSQNSAEFRLQVVMAVTPKNLDRIASLNRTVRAHGADELSLLPVHDLVASVPDPDDRDELDTSRLANLGLENSNEYLSGIGRFLKGEKTPGTCSAPRTAVFVDPAGRVFACTPGATLRSGGIQATPQTLEAIVRGGLDSTVPRERCDRCWWNCHREFDIAIGAERWDRT